MKEVSLPSRMLDHVRKHGDPETIIPFMIRVHLDYVKKSIDEDSCGFHQVKSGVSKTVVVALCLIFSFQNVLLLAGGF
jgi:hypothetical protein